MCEFLSTVGSDHFLRVSVERKQFSRFCCCFIQTHQYNFHNFLLTKLYTKVLRGSDCKYRESADKLRKSKILITCQKNTFGELSSKILLKPSGFLLFLGTSEKQFCLIYCAIIRLKIKQIESACF